MEMTEFARKVCVAVQGELDETYKVELKTIRKNNGVKLQGLLIMAPGCNISPTIYMESFLDAYENGCTFRDIINQILDIYYMKRPKELIEMEFFSDFNKVCDRICFKLINKKENADILDEIPYIDFMDLAICFFYSCGEKGLGEGTVLIYNSHVKMWNCSVKVLMEYAMKNTPVIYPVKKLSIIEMLQDLGMQEDWDSEEPISVGKSGMEILTNAKKTQGAAAILYPGVLEELARQKKKGFYIIPSSIHETLLLDEDRAGETDSVKRMIYEINREHVAKEEVLSDNLYYYDFKDKTVRIV